MNSVATVPALPKPTSRARTKTAFYVALSVFMVAIVFSGFGPSYYGPLLRGQANRPLIVHIHGVVFMGWMALLLAQVALAWRGQVRLHRQVGAWGIGYGCLIVAMGIIVGIAAPVMHLASGEWPRERASGFLLVTLSDMVLFGSLFGAAVWFRRKPEIHKRLMLAATVALLFAAVARIETTWLHSPPLAAVIWLSPLLIGMAYDWRTRGRPHAAYVISTAWLLVGALRLTVAGTPAWQPVGNAILDLF